MAHPGSDDPINPAAESEPTSAPPSRVGEGMASRLPAGMVVSRYRIESVLGEGAMGLVYLARQERPDRQVALKLIRPGLASPRMLRRFEQEAEVLGRLLHPGIAQIYEAGTADAGHGPQPFFAMELVRGVSLTEYASEKELSTRQRLELISKVCDAVEHAHQKGVIHRDLKPGNILVTEEGQPKILDFGVARATDSDLQQTTMQTDVGALIGTLPYMSPEQVGGDSAELDTRSDVYALGVILFELLARRLPYSLERRMIHEAARVIREEEPSRLSSINKTLRGDVETIVAHALEKEKSRRYQTASALGADIRRYLADEPITARPASTWYQLRKFSRRNRALVGGVAATFAVLVVGLAVSLYAFAQASYQRDEKGKALKLARDEAENARLAQEAEKQRADELDQVAQFQAAQFEGLDTQLMGIRLRTDMIADAAAALEKSGMSAEEVTSATKQLEETLARGNPTNVALKALYDNIFARALKTVDEQFKDQPLVRARLLQTIADTLRELGLLEQAMAPQTKALELHRQERGEEQPETLTSVNNMGVLLLARGKLLEAEACFREAIEFRRSMGEEHPEILAAINNMGVLLEAQGKANEAEAFFREALEKRRRVLGNEHPHTLLSLNNLGYLCQSQRRLAEAEQYYHEALRVRRRTLGEEHPSTLVSINNMCGVLQAQGKLAEAEKYLREAFEKSQRVLGAEHPQTLAVTNNLGFLLRAQGKLVEAEPYFRDVMDKGRLALGEEHPNTLVAIGNLAGLLRAQGRLIEAEPFYRETLEKSRRTLGEEHPETLRYLANLGSLLQAQGKFEDTVSLLIPMELTMRKFGQRNGPALAGFLTTLGRARAGMAFDADRFALAESNLLESHRILARARGESHANTRSCTQYVIALYSTWHAAEPDKGYDVKAAEWRAKLEELQAATRPAVTQPATQPSTEPAATKSSG